jgi:mannose-6-phosphate isomerase-like protein (cupin superfamily)
MDDTRSAPHTLFLLPGEGRSYALGSLSAVFKADNAETDDRYSVSEWWLDPHTDGPGAHSHEHNDEIFYVIEGVASMLTGDQWRDAPAGTFLRIPATVTHDFRNLTDAPVGLLNVFIPGGFEQNMPAIVNWFRENR